MLPFLALSLSLSQGVNLPFVVLGTGSGQHGDVANATATWLSSSTGGVGIDTAYDYDDEVAVGTGVKASGKSGADVFIETKIPCSTYRKAKQAIASNLYVSAWRRGGVTAWRRGGVAAWRRGCVAA